MICRFSKHQQCWFHAVTSPRTTGAPTIYGLGPVLNQPQFINAAGSPPFSPAPPPSGDCVLCQQSGQQSGLSLATGFPFLALGAPARPDPDLTRSCGLKLNTARPAGRDQRSLPQSTSSKRLGPDPGRRLGAELASDPLPLAQSFSNLSVHHLNGLLKQIAELHPRSSCLSKFSVGPENLPF